MKINSIRPCVRASVRASVARVRVRRRRRRSRKATSPRVWGGGRRPRGAGISSTSHDSKTTAADRGVRGHSASRDSKEMKRSKKLESPTNDRHDDTTRNVRRDGDDGDGDDDDGDGDAMELDDDE